MNWQKKGWICKIALKMGGCPISDLDQRNVGLWQKQHTYVFSCDRPQRFRSQKLVMLLVEHVVVDLIWLLRRTSPLSMGPTTLSFDRSWLSRSPISPSSPSPPATFPNIKPNLSSKSFRRAASPRRFVLKIHFFIEFGQKMIQFKIQFKTKSKKIFIQ